MIATLLGLIVTVACAGYGATALTLLGLDERRGGLRWWCLSWGLGFGLLTMALFWCGIARLLVTPMLAGLVLLGIALGARALFCRRVDGPEVPAPSVPVGRAARAILALTIAICVAANLMGASTPPNFIDALVYHLYVPSQFLFHHAVVELHGIWQHYQPTAVELLYMLPLAAGSAKGAAVLGMTTGLFAAASAYLLAARLSGPLAGLMAAAIFYCNPMVAWESTSCFLELSIAALGTLGLLALLNWNDTGRRSWLVIAASLLGFAASCKLNAGSFVVTGLLVVFWQSLSRGDGVRTGLIRALGVGALASVPVLPWLIRSTILTGNPVYPFATPIFGANPERAGIDWVFAHYGVGYSLVDRLLAPWRLFTQGAAFENGNYLSPLPVLMMPVILLRAWKARGDRPWLLLAALVLVEIWAFGGHVARYIVPVTPLLCALGADALCWLIGFGGRRRVMAVAVGATFLLFGAATTLLYDKQFIPVALGRETEDAYLQRTTWYYQTFRDVCASMGPSGRVLTNAQEPTFYLACPRGRALDSDFDQPELFRRLVAEGRFTDILIMNNPGIGRKVEAILGSAARLIWTRQLDVMVSRTFGRTAVRTVTLYHLVPTR